MINEAIIRSPKWLRRFADFEINTGDDIKGEPSKRRIAKKFDARWNECFNNGSYKDTYKFKKFYQLVIDPDYELLFKDNEKETLKRIHKNHQYDMLLWDKFDVFKACDLVFEYFSTVKKVTITDDLMVSVYDNSYIYIKTVDGRIPDIAKLSNLPAKIDSIHASLSLHGALNTLENFPDKIHGAISFPDNTKLKNLIGGPSFVDGNLSMEGFGLESLEGSPKYIGGYFNCDNNKITSLKGAPDVVEGNFWLRQNDIWNVDYFPKKLIGKIIIRDNPIYSIFDIVSSSRLGSLIRLLEDYDIIREDENGDKAIVGVRFCELLVDMKVTTNYQLSKFTDSSGLRVEAALKYWCPDVLKYYKII